MSLYSVVFYVLVNVVWMLVLNSIVCVFVYVDLCVDLLCICVCRSACVSVLRIYVCRCVCGACMLL